VSAGKKSLAAIARECHLLTHSMRRLMTMLSFRKQAPRRVWSVGCLAAFLTLLLFTSSESLHKLIHPDADSPDHECAITMLAHGQVNAPAVPPVLVVFAAGIFFLLPLFETAEFSSFDYRFCFSRAPPRF
jgi:hypothetical protein